MVGVFFFCGTKISNARAKRILILFSLPPPVSPFALFAPLQSGRYFYRVCNPNGARLHQKADPKSKMRKELLPEGQVLEASHKWTPAGSPVTFVTMVNRRGFVIQKCGERVRGRS